MTDLAASQSSIPAKSDLPIAALHREGHTHAGKILGDRYLLRSVLGRGGFGIVFLARNIALPGQPLCVIKQLAPPSTDPQLVAIARHQFELEALSLSRLSSHAQIPSLLDYLQIGTDLYLVEEYIPGIDLRQIVSNQRRFTELEVENFLTQMLRVVKYIHSHHLIHRDLKPQNIILCRTDRRFVLVDFGSVKDIAPTTQPSQRMETIAIGTPGFTPPEQLADRTVDASDIYALGMTCIYLLTGKEPSQFPTDDRTCELLWADTVEISTGLSDIIAKTIQIPLSERYHSAAAVLTALENRSIRAKLRTYLDRKHAIATSDSSGKPSSHYPAVVEWALGIDRASESATGDRVERKM
ncbi:protein kinase [Chamaesiphon sp.]|uniref:protein kinase domain-containing protein n=1 Tax=Chamaesiphon sp. TaxID=2814140 RepID=UPI0035944B82